MKLIVLIYTHKNNFFKIKFLKDSWIKDLSKYNISYYFVTGDDLKDEPVIKLNFKECYEQLPLKTFLSLKELYNKEYTHLLKTDDDTFIDVNSLIKLNFNDLNYYGRGVQPNNNIDAHFYKCKDKAYHLPKRKTEFSYAEGGAYILSKKAVDIIASYPENYFLNTPLNYRGEDVIVGELLAKNNILLEDGYNKKVGELLKMDITEISFHPVHFSLLSKLSNLNAEQKIKLLQQNPYLNDYIKKVIVDTQRKKLVNTNS